MSRAVKISEELYRQMRESDLAKAGVPFTRIITDAVREYLQAKNQEPVRTRRRKAG